MLGGTCQRGWRSADEFCLLTGHLHVGSSSSGCVHLCVFLLQVRCRTPAATRCWLCATGLWLGGTSAACHTRCATLWSWNTWTGEGPSTAQRSTAQEGWSCEGLPGQPQRPCLDSNARLHVLCLLCSWTLYCTLCLLFCCFCRGNLHQVCVCVCVCNLLLSCIALSVHECMPAWAQLVSGPCLQLCCLRIAGCPL